MVRCSWTLSGLANRSRQQTRGLRRLLAQEAEQLGQSGAAACPTNARTGKRTHGPPQRMLPCTRAQASYDEVEIEDMTFNPELQAYQYSCPCGDLFEISLVGGGVPEGWRPVVAGLQGTA